MLESDQNVLINVLNVIYRISDRQFIYEEWGTLFHQKRTSLVVSCLDAFKTLEDYSFFDLLQEGHGVWKELIAELSPETVSSMLKFGSRIYEFGDLEEDGYSLLKNEEWNYIMFLASDVVKNLKLDLGIVDNREFLV